MDDVHYRLGRGRSLLFGISAALAAFGLTVGILLWVDSADDADTPTRVAEAAELDIPGTLPAIDEPFEELPGESSTVSTVSTTTTPPATPAPSTTSTTTTLPPTTTSTAPAAPVAPPSDPNGAEPQIQLGGISIPKLGVDEPLYEGIRLTTLDRGPGHWPGTAMPGQVGNVVVAAHRTSHGGPFRHIDQLVPGDTVDFTTENGVTTYAVTETMVVQPDAVWIVDPTETATATLFACHPPGSVAERIVVKLDLQE